MARLLRILLVLGFLGMLVRALVAPDATPTATPEKRATEQDYATRVAKARATLIAQQVATLEPRIAGLAAITVRKEQKAEAKRIAAELKKLQRTEATMPLIDAWRSHPIVLKLAAEEADATAKFVRAEWPKTRQALQRAFADRVDSLLIDARVESRTDVITLKGKPALRVTAPIMGRVLANQLANTAELAHRAEEAGFYAFVAKNSISEDTYTWTLKPKEVDPGTTAKRETARLWFLED